MAIEYQVFSDVSDVSLGGTNIHGVLRISITRKRPQLRAAGDEDIYESVARGGPASLSGTIELPDIAQAQALDSATGTLSFTAQDGRGQSNKTVTVTSVRATGVELSAKNQGGSKATISFVAESSDGSTDPLSVS